MPLFLKNLCCLLIDKILHLYCNKFYKKHPNNNKYKKGYFVTYFFLPPSLNFKNKSKILDIKSENNSKDELRNQLKAQYYSLAAKTNNVPPIQQEIINLSSLLGICYHKCSISVVLPHGNPCGYISIY